MVDSKNDYEVCNIVLSGSLSEEVDREKIAEYFGEDTEYNPSTFPGVCIHTNDDSKITVNLYKDSVTAAGLTDLENSVEKLENFSDELPEDISITDVSISNTMVHSSIDSKLNLRVLSLYLGLEQCEYEPEQFPGIIYKPQDYNYCALIFSNGKFNIGGLTNIEEIEEAVEHLTNTLKNAPETNI